MQKRWLDETANCFQGCRMHISGSVFRVAGACLSSVRQAPAVAVLVPTVHTRSFAQQRGEVYTVSQNLPKGSIT
jgi:hypothetical protein